MLQVATTSRASCNKQKKHTKEHRQKNTHRQRQHTTSTLVHATPCSCFRPKIPALPLFPNNNNSDMLQLPHQQLQLQLQHWLMQLQTKKKKIKYKYKNKNTKNICSVLLPIAKCNYPKLIYIYIIKYIYILYTLNIYIFFLL